MEGNVQGVHKNNIVILLDKRYLIMISKLKACLS